MKGYVKGYRLFFIPALLAGLFTAITVPFAQDDSGKKSSGWQLKWPVDTHKTFIISSTFGESRMDHFHNGLDIAGKGINVYPVQKGQLVWKTQSVMRPGDIPFGGGKTIVLRHAEIWSGYMHLSAINPELQKLNEIPQDTSLGKSGDTGHSGGAHLHFFIYDPHQKKMINPLPYLETGMYKNSLPPVSAGYGIMVEDGFVKLNLKRTFKMSEDFPFYVRVIDSGTGREKWGVYKLESFTDEEMKNPVRSYVFNYLIFKDKHWRTSNGFIFEDAYYENWLNLGTGFKKNKKIIWKASGYLGPEITEEAKIKYKE